MNSYEIIRANVTEMWRFQHLVQDRIGDGWRPLGAPFIDGPYIYQAMTRD